MGHGAKRRHYPYLEMEGRQCGSRIQLCKGSEDHGASGRSEQTGKFKDRSGFQDWILIFDREKLRIQLVLLFVEGQTFVEPKELEETMLKYFLKNRDEKMNDR